MTSTKQTISCRICCAETKMLGTQLCNRCWELARRIESDPSIARRLLWEHDTRELDRMASGLREIAEKVNGELDQALIRDALYLEGFNVHRR